MKGEGGEEAKAWDCYNKSPNSPLLQTIALPPSCRRPQYLPSEVLLWYGGNFVCVDTLDVNPSKVKGEMCLVVVRVLGTQNSVGFCGTLRAPTRFK